MIDNHYHIRIAGTSYSPEFQKEEKFSDRWQAALARAHGSHGQCQCPGSGDRNLSIKPREASNGKVTYHLAKFPNTGHQHVNECRFHSAEPERSGLQGYDLDVVVETDDGNLRVRLARGIRIRPSDNELADPVRRPGKARGVSQSAMTLRGLLDLLWTEARLNVWYPAMAGKRSRSLVHFRLAQAASRISTSRMSLSDVLLVAAAKGSQEEKANKQRVTQALKNGFRLVVVSPLARYNQEQHPDELAGLPLGGPFGMPTMNIPTDVWRRVARSFRRELAVWRANYRVMAIAQLAARPGTDGRTWDVLDIGLMHVSDRWIPLDSRHEGEIEQRLHDQQRAFNKPLRFDADECEYFPDFWLLDAGKDFPLEVFGMATQDYLEQKESKSVWYDKKYGHDGWWKWDAAVDPQKRQIPAFPQNKRMVAAAD